MQQLDQQSLQHEIQKTLDEIPGAGIGPKANYLATKLGVLRELEKGDYPLSQLQQVIKMHEKFGITNQEVPFSGIEEYTFRNKCMQEELDEFWNAKDKEEQFDALIDLIVFALGTIERLGFASIYAEGFERVMKANLAKEVGPNTKRGSFSIDLKKPEGWKAPDHSDLIDKITVTERTENE